MMRLHLLGLPHTVTSDEFSHCAYTGKVQRFPAMMRALGYEVWHYGVEGAETAAHRQLDVMTRDEQEVLRGPRRGDPGYTYGLDARTDSPLYREFNRRLRKMLLENVRACDLVLLPFGHAHHDAVGGLPLTLVESGIGYPTLYAGARFRVYESEAWRHWHLGKAGLAEGNSYEWVVPNYFDVKAWDVEAAPPMDTVVFLGRIGRDKGLDTVVEVAKARPDLRFVICGQGDPAPYISQAGNIEYHPPITGRDRSAFLGRARCALMPTVFVEPFGGVAVEAQLCGTPVLSTPYGAFTETIEDGVTGFRCHTLGDFLAALDRAPSLDRARIAERARSLYGMDRIGPMYDRVFRQIADLHFDGWYTRTSTLAPDLDERPEP